MDVVDLGVADHGRLRRCRVGDGARRQQHAQRAAFGRAAAGDGGHRGVGDVPALHRALGVRQRRRRAARQTRPTRG